MLNTKDQVSFPGYAYYQSDSRKMILAMTFWGRGQLETPHFGTLLDSALLLLAEFDIVIVS